QAIEIAQSSGAKLTLCTVLEISEQAYHLIEIDKDNLHRTVEDVAAADLARIASTVRAGGVEVESKLLIGKPSEQITKEVLRSGHDLVVVGTRKRSSVARALFGGTCNKLIRLCPVPIWVVKAEEVRELREVLVASDFSEVGQQVTAAGVMVAGHLNAKLFIAHALEFPFEAYLRTAGVSEQEVATYRTRMHDEATQNMNQQLAQTDYRTLAQGVKVEVVEGTPDAVVPQLIEEHEIDLLVIGTHGRSGFSGMLLGNTAERILPHAHCSLLIVKPADFVSPVTV
ncbi:MAG: hypothetical protein B7Z55_17400, partial [Planctomycetales bacterium 12-60-4]